MIPVTAMMRGFLPSYDLEIVSHVLESLRSDDLEDMRLAMQEMERNRWPEDIQEDMQRLYKGRSLYNEGGLEELSEEERLAAEEYLRRADIEGTLELSARILGYVPRELIGDMPMPPGLARLMNDLSVEANLPVADVVALSPELQPE